MSATNPFKRISGQPRAIFLIKIVFKLLFPGGIEDIPDEKHLERELVKY